MSTAEHEPRTCPVCSGKLERDGVCLACLLQEGLEAERVTGTGEAAAKAAPERALTLPCEFAGYRLVREIASGGMGIVYEAEDVKLKRLVAMKVVRNAHFATREEAARFKAETQAVAQLDHADIVPIYESGEEEGVPYFTMRLAEGGSLADRLKRRGVMPEREAATFMVRIAKAVQYAHEHGVLHRDLKPANILLDVAGRPMLSDFGLAKLLDAEFQLTKSHAYVGTPHYMSPEQAAGKAKEVTTASDVWALGVMLFQMLTAKLPFTGGSAVEVMRKITQEEPEISSSGKLTVRKGEVKAGKEKVSAASLGRVHADLATLILRCLEKRPERRLPSAGFLADELERFLSGEPIESRAVGTVERVWKLAKRNKAVTLAVMGTSFSLIAGTGVALWQMVKAQVAEKVALKQEAEAEEVSHMILGAVNELDELSAGRQIDLQELRKELMERIHEFKGDPVRKANLLRGIELVYANKASIEACQDALEQLRKQFGPDDPLVWDMRSAIAEKKTLLEPGSEELIEELRAVLAWKRGHYGPRHEETIFTMGELGQCLTSTGADGAREAMVVLAEACAVATNNKNLSASYRVKCRFLHASAVFLSGEQEEGLKLSREYCRLAQEELGREHLRTALTYDWHARHCLEAGMLDEAAAAGFSALDSYWSSVGPDNSYAKGCLRRQSEMLLKKGDLEPRLGLMKDALRACDQQLGPLNEMTLFRAEACVVALNDLRRRNEAAELGEEWLERVRRRDGSLPPVAEELLREHALTLRRLQRHAQAEGALRELLSMEGPEKSESLRHYADLSNLAETLINQKRAAEALPMLQQVVQAFEKRGGTAAVLNAKVLPLAKRRLAEAEEELEAEKSTVR